MAQINQLGEILVRALPTFVIVILLYWYLKKVFFQPIEAVLEKRRAATEGALEQAESVVAQAAEKAAEYETALAQARAVIYGENEELRKQWAADQAAAVESARQNAAAQVAAAKAELAGQVQTARETLGAESERLAEQIAQSVLTGRAN